MKSKAHPREYQGDGPVSIPTAYCELSKRAFAVWVRLMAESPEVLLTGRHRLAELLSYSQRRFSEVLLELVRKGYVGVIPPERVGLVTQIVLRRRAKINQRTGNWFRLGNLLLQGDHECMCNQQETGPKFTQTQSLHRPKPKFSWADPNFNWTHGIKPGEVVCKKVPRETSSCVEGGSCSHKSGICPDKSGNLTNWVQLNFGLVCVNFGSPRVVGSVVLVESIDYWNTQGVKKLPDGNSCHMAAMMLSGVKKRRFVAGTKTQTKRTTLEVDRLREAKEKEKEKRRLSTRAKRGFSKQRRGKGVDWAKIDLMGDPVVSFEPGDRERPRVLEVLSRRARDPERVRLVAKLEREFCRIYTRYRRQAERDLTGSTDYNEVWEQERKLAARAAILCIQKGTTPTRLIRYWHKAIRDFTDLKIPTLRFLASPANVDRAACAEINIDDAKDKPPAGNSFSAVCGLDVRLRPELERAGFDTRPYNDRFMLGIQHNAMAIAQGKDIFMAKGRVRDMAVFAAENLFNEE